MNRQSLWIVLCALVMASMSLSACAPAATPAPHVPAAAQQPAASSAVKEMVTIRWRNRPDNQAEQDAYQAISDELSKKLEAQGIRLQYEPAAAPGYFDQLSAEYIRALALVGNRVYVANYFSDDLAVVDLALSSHEAERLALGPTPRAVVRPKGRNVIQRRKNLLSGMAELRQLS